MLSVPLRTVNQRNDLKSCRTRWVVCVTAPLGRQERPRVAAEPNFNASGWSWEAAGDCGHHGDKIRNLRSNVWQRLRMWWNYIRTDVLTLTWSYERERQWITTANRHLMSFCFISVPFLLNIVIFFRFLLKAMRHIWTIPTLIVSSWIWAQQTFNLGLKKMI